jgi:hypothetical protein
MSQRVVRRVWSGLRVRDHMHKRLWPTKRVFSYAKAKQTPSLPSAVGISKMLGLKWTWAVLVGSRLLA